MGKVLQSIIKKNLALGLGHESFHPSHLKKSLPVSQLISLKRICEIPEQYYENKEEMLKKVKERNYEGLDKICRKKKVDSKSRKFYLEIKKPPKHKSNLVF